MGFTEVASLDADVTYALGKKDKSGKPYPKQAEGYYLGSRTVKGSRGDSTLHFLQTPKGNVGLWGTTDLNRKLGSATPGTMVRVTSTGTKPTPKGDMYTYKVEVDADNTIEVANFASGSDNDSLESVNADDSDTSYNAAEEESNEDAEQDALLAAQEAAAIRRAKVQAMLNKGKTK